MTKWDLISLIEKDPDVLYEFIGVDNNDLMVKARELGYNVEEDKAN